MRNDKADPADDAGDRDGGRGDQRCRKHQHDAQPAGIDAERACFLFTERHDVHAPAQEKKRDDADDQRRKDGNDIA
ncbi:hypothetical protein D9M72_652500 [compost metagenome]